MGIFYPSGGYLGRVVKQELSESKEKRTPQLVLMVKVIAELDTVTNEPIPLPEAQQHDVWVYLYLTEKAQEMTLKALNVLGYRRTSLRFLDPTEADFENLADREVPLWCKHEEYEGEQREKWQISTPRDSKPVEPGKLKKLDALFGKGLKELATSKPAGAVHNANKALAEEAASVQGADDIPF